MSDTIIKHFFIILCCIFLYQHLLNFKFAKKKQILLLLIITLFLSICMYWGKKYLPAISDVILLLFLWLSLDLTLQHPQLSLLVVTISYCFSYGLFAISSTVMLTLFTPIFYSSSAFPYNCFMFFSGILEYCLMKTILRIKRFRKGMPFLYSTAFLNAGTFTCLVIIVLIAYIQLSANPPLYFVILVPIAFASSIGAFIYWWQKQLTQAYLTKLKLLELESLRTELLEKNIRISELMKQNEELSRLIHKDNKLISAMENAVYNYLCTKNERYNSISYGKSLLSDLQKISENRQEILSSFSCANSSIFSTGITSLDALLTYMDKQAHFANISFSVNICPNLSLMIPGEISAEDLAHLLADLIENSFIAVSHLTDNQKKIVQLQIFLHRNALLVELSDTGIAFEIPTFMKFGIEPATTHAESGGSGIGLKDIWKIKNKYNASIHIAEYETAFPFCKKITFLLDHKNHYLIHSWRAEQIIALQNRGDLKVLEIK